MRVYVTGGSGFVGSNVARIAADRGHAVTCVGRSLPPLPDARCSYETLDLVDNSAVARSVLAAAPDLIVHTAILNDFDRILARRDEGWDAYVATTRTLASESNRVSAGFVFISTDWVFDGTQVGAGEATPPNPVNYYGVLKLAGELVTLERAERPIVARIAGVMGSHWTRPRLPRAQDAGFGYFVSALVDALSAGKTFTVWEADSINMRATPSLASVSAGMILDLAERGSRGTFHCCGGEAMGRMELARAAAAVFELDPSLLRSGSPPPQPAPVPFDTSLSAVATATALGVELPSATDLLTRFRTELLATG